jgi:hypothetical protein
MNESGDEVANRWLSFELWTGETQPRLESMSTFRGWSVTMTGAPARESHCPHGSGRLLQSDAQRRSWAQF